MDNIDLEKKPPSDSSPEEDESVNLSDDNTPVLNLARQLSQLSVSSTNFTPGTDVNPFLDSSKDPRLDPFSKQFSASFFVKALLDIGSRDPETFPVRTAGIAFRNLSAYGFGSTADFQKTVVNVFLDGLNSLASLVTRNKGRRIDILRNFEGVLQPGEMLMVLGRPGSYVRTICLLSKRSFANVCIIVVVLLSSKRLLVTLMATMLLMTLT